MPTYTITIPDQAEFDATIADLCLAGGRQDDDVRSPGLFAHLEIIGMIYHRRVQAAQIRATQQAAAALLAVQAEITSEVIP